MGRRIHLRRPMGRRRRRTPVPPAVSRLWQRFVKLTRTRESANLARDMGVADTNAAAAEPVSQTPVFKHLDAPDPQAEPTSADAPPGSGPVTLTNRVDDMRLG